MQVGNHVIKFDVGEAMKHLHEDYSLLGLSVVDSLMFICATMILVLV